MRPALAPAAPPYRQEQCVAKKPNYDFEKRRKELERKAKKDAKREERLERRRNGLSDEPEVMVDADGNVVEVSTQPDPE